MSNERMQTVERVSQRSDVLFQNVDDEIVLLHLETGAYYGLNQVASRIWTLTWECEGLVAPVVSKMCQEYDAPEATLSADVREMLTALADMRLIEVTES